MSQKICAAEGCEASIPRYMISNDLCQEHGSQIAKQTRKKRSNQAGAGELEAYRKALLEETLISLIRDPSRWSWQTAGDEGGNGRDIRTRPRAGADNRCPGWMCDVAMEAPLRPGQYCSAECKKQTGYIRKAFRRDLERLRSGTAHPCIECGQLMFRRTDAKACSTRCYQRNYQRERQRQLRGYKPRHSPASASVKGDSRADQEAVA
jgi:hypothetical protein